MRTAAISGKTGETVPAAGNRCRLQEMFCMDKMALLSCKRLGVAMNDVKMIMLDSGIGQYQAEETEKYTGNQGTETDIDSIGHGCAVYHILRSAKIPVESYKVMDSNEIEEDALIEALNDLACRDDLENTVINLSMGVTFCRRKKELLRLCQQLNEKGSILVCAFDNDGAVSYPAAFPCVIGVDVSRTCRKLTEFEFVEHSMVNIRGFGGVQLLPDQTGKRIKYIGSSFVAPHFTVMIAKMLQTQKMNLQQVLEVLKQNAMKVYSGTSMNPCVQKMPDIHKAIVLPLNKEIVNLLRYPELLSFEITGIFDFHHMRTVGKTVSQIIGRDTFSDYTVKDVKDIDWNADFDTVIMGHMSEIDQALHHNYTKYFLEQAKTYKKQIYAFDILTEYLDSSGQLDLTFPQINAASVPQNRFGKQFQIHCPIIGVFGTSSRQGKFTLQLELRKRFLKDQFQVAQFSTEPNGLLYGMDAVYPMGYGGSLELSGSEEIIYINDLLNQIVTDETDVLILGSQSQTVAYSSQNIALYPLGNVNLLLGSFPDVVILCVNTYDDDNYIRRSISYLEGIVDTRVAALVVSPFMQEYSGSTMVRNSYKIEDDRLRTYKEELKNKFHLETFLLNQEEDLDLLYRLLIGMMTG